MSLTGEQIKQLAALGLTVEQIAGVVDIVAGSEKDKKEKARQYKAEYREKKKQLSELSELSSDNIGQKGQPPLKVSNGFPDLSLTSKSPPLYPPQKFSMPDWLKPHAELWDEYMAVRKKKKAVDTPKAKQLLVAELERLSAGCPENVPKIIEQSIRNGWKDFYELRTEKGFQNGTKQQLRSSPAGG